ncbi:hypothetical protein D3C85_979880 [compost metagenome]
MTKHLFIPDVQAKDGVPLQHLEALGNYTVEKKPDVIVCIGDWADMPSLSSYDVGKKSFEGRSYTKDIEAARLAMDVYLAPIKQYNLQQAIAKKKQYKPRMVMCFGNHDQARIERAIEFDRKLEGLISVDDLEFDKDGWECHDFLEIVNVDGIRYSHYFCNPHSLIKNCVGGTIDSKLKNLGWSFSMGHQQTLQYGVQYLSDGERRQGLVAGAFYMHNEGYMGTQGNASHWRGIVMKHRVQEGSYDPCFVSLDYLLEKYI